MLSISIRPCPYAVLITIVYYRLYSRESALASKTSFKRDEPSFGRINVLSIKPPQTVTSLKAPIAKVEECRGVDVQLLEDIFSEKEIENGIISFFGASYPGQQEDQPMAVICNLLDQATTSSRVLGPLKLRQEGQSTVLSSGCKKYSASLKFQKKVSLR